MNKKTRKDLAIVVSGMFLMLCLYLYWGVFDSNSIFIFLGIVIFTPIVREVVFRLLPAKSSGRKRKKAGSHLTSSSKRLLPDAQIMNLPLQQLSWRELERLCYLYFKARGYKPKETAEGADGGVDLVIYNSRDKGYEAVQIKHYIDSSRPITVKEIRELNSAKRNHHCMLARFITTSRFSKEALQEADKYHITCNNIDWVKQRIEAWRTEKMQKGTS